MQPGVVEGRSGPRKAGGSHERLRPRFVPGVSPKSGGVIERGQPLERKNRGEVGVFPSTSSSLPFSHRRTLNGKGELEKRPLTGGGDNIPATKQVALKIKEEKEGRILIYSGNILLTFFKRSNASYVAREMGHIVKFKSNGMDQTTHGSERSLMEGKHPEGYLYPIRLPL